MPRPPHSPWLYLPNDIWGWVQIMKFLIVQLPPFSRHLIPLRPNILLRTLFSNTLSLCSRLCVVIRNKYWVLRGRVVSPPPTPQAGAPPSVGCPRLLIQHIRSYPPYLEAVSSIRNPRIGFDWFRTGTGGGLLWVRWWTFGFLRHGVSYMITA
jgi:hypothetical protein